MIYTFYLNLFIIIYFQTVQAGGKKGSQTISANHRVYFL